MRVYAISDLHVDYQENREWVSRLSQLDYQDDILVLAGDISDKTRQVEQVFTRLETCFKKVFFVPGNHDLWVIRNGHQDSFSRFRRVLDLAEDHGIRTTPMTIDELAIVPLFAWYDYSFAPLSAELQACWNDFTACKWPDGYDVDRINRYFLSLNEPLPFFTDKYVISFSHFLSRIDVMPSFIPADKRFLYAAFGSSRLEKQIRQLESRIHVYGHSHFNRQVLKDDTLYINSAYGYPSESHISRKQLTCIYDSKAQTNP